MKIIDERLIDTLDSWTILPGKRTISEYRAVRRLDQADLSISLCPFI